jgi:hypothetical protein
LVAYARFLASELPKAVGLDGADGRRKSDGRAGHLCHGPYITLGPGRYTAGFYIQRDPGDAEGEVELEVCNEHGRRVFATRTAPMKDLFTTIDGLVHVDFRTRRGRARLRASPACSRPRADRSEPRGRVPARRRGMGRPVTNLHGGARSEFEELRREIERLRAFVELRAQTQENLTRAMLAQSTARTAEALEGRIQIAAREAMAFAAEGLEKHEATLRALGRRLAETPAAPAAPEPQAAAPFSTGAYLIGGGGGGVDARDCKWLDIRDDSEDAFLADLANLPIPQGGAAKLVAAHVAEFVSAASLRQSILPHWRSRLAPGGELVVVTLDGPAWAAALARTAGDFARFRRTLSVEGKPPRSLFDAAEWVKMLGEAGLTPGEPATAPPHELTIAARAAPA